MSSDAPPSLFATCPMANCGNPVEDPRHVCDACLETFGPYLQAAHTAPSVEEFTATVAAGDARVTAVMAARLAGPPAPSPPAEVEWRANQVCWVCEDRRKCRHDPDHPKRWICRSCALIDLPDPVHQGDVFSRIEASQEH